MAVNSERGEPGPDRAAAANPDQRGERGVTGTGWWRHGPGPSEVDEESERPSRGPGRRIQQVTIRWLERGEERVTNLGITSLAGLAGVAISTILISGRHQWLGRGQTTHARWRHEIKLPIVFTHAQFFPPSDLGSWQREWVERGWAPASKWAEVQTRNSGAGCRPSVPAGSVVIFACYVMFSKYFTVSLYEKLCPPVGCGGNINIHGGCKLVTAAPPRHATRATRPKRPGLFISLGSSQIKDLCRLDLWQTW